jgi:hypothetical protein
MKVYVFLFLWTLLGAAWGLYGLLKPKDAWKRSFQSSFKVREPNEADILMMKIMSVVWITFVLCFTVGFLIKMN